MVSNVSPEGDDVFPLLSFHRIDLRHNVVGKSHLVARLLISVSVDVAYIQSDCSSAKVHHSYLLWFFEINTETTDRSLVEQALLRSIFFDTRNILLLLIL
jgi:hypothetical protein